jgi:hypothetical protein
MEETKRKKVINMENKEPQAKQEPKGYKLVDQQVVKEQMSEGNYYFNGRIGEKPVKIITKHESTVKCEIWNDYQSKFKVFTCSYDGFYTKVQMPVYE